MDLKETGWRCGLDSSCSGNGQLLNCFERVNEPLSFRSVLGPTMRAGMSSPRVKRPGRKPDRSHPSSNKTRNV
jgi:hypothetical protein